MSGSVRVVDSGYRLSLVRRDYLGDHTLSYAVEYLYGWSVRLGRGNRVRARGKVAAALLLVGSEGGACLLKLTTTVGAQT